MPSALPPRDRRMAALGAWGIDSRALAAGQGRLAMPLGSVATALPWSWGVTLSVG